MIKIKNIILALVFALTLFNIVSALPITKAADEAAPAAADAGTGTKIYTSETADLDFIYLGGPKTVPELLFKIMRFLNITIASVAVLAIMIGGVMLITSAGSENQMNRGKDIIKYSLLGLGIGIFGYLIVTFVQTILYQIPS